MVVDRKFDPSDPLSICKLTRRETIEFIDVENKKHVLSRCDCGCVKRESQTCRYVKHVMSQITTLEDFHPDILSHTLNLCTKMMNVRK